MTGHAAFSPDGTQVLAISNDNTVWLWDARSRQPLLSLQGHTDWITHATFSPDGSHVLTASKDRTARLWDADSGQSLHVLQGHEQGVTQAVFSTDGSRVLTASNDNTARLWDAQSGQSLSVLQEHECGKNSFGDEQCGIIHAAFSRDGARVLTVSEANIVRLWNAQSGQSQLVLPDHGRYVIHAVFSPNGTRVLTSTGDIIQLWDAQSGQSLLKRHDVTQAVFSPDGLRLLTGSRDNIARLWDTQNGQSLFVLQGHGCGKDIFGERCAITHAAFSPDGSRVLTTSDDNTARLWDAQTGQSLLVLPGHECGRNIIAGDRQCGITHAAFSHNGLRVLTVSNDKTVRLWDAQSGQSLFVLQGYEDRVTHAAFSPDGARVFTTSEDMPLWSVVRLWPLFADVDALIAYAQSILPRKQFTCKEREEYFLELIERCVFVADGYIQGDNYEGEYDEKQGQAHGQGKTQGINRYEGGFAHGRKHGHGVYIWKNGEKLEGEFDQDMFAGIAVPQAANDWLDLALWKMEQEEFEAALHILDIQEQVQPDNPDIKSMREKIHRLR